MEQASTQPLAWWNVETTTPTPERALRELVELRTVLNGIEALLVARARDNGASWAEVGDLLGITKQSAHRRHRPRPADSASQAAPTLDVEADVEDVAVADDVGLPLQPLRPAPRRLGV